MGLAESGLTELRLELVLAAAMLTVAAFWVRRRSKPNPLIVLLTAGLVGAATWTGLEYLEQPDPESQVENRPIQVSTEGYVSSDTCQSCHPAQYDSWRASYHRTMTQVVTPETVAADLDGVELSTDAATYRLYREGDEFFVHEERRVKGRTQRRKMPIVMSTGSHSMQIYWASPGPDRRVEIVPFHYLIHEDLWIPRRASFITPPGRDVFGTEWNTGCILCHATKGQPRLGRRPRVDSHVAEFGIACEACHGPGQEHVEANRDPVRRYDLHLGEASDPTIVDPSDLPKHRASEVCGRCHAYAVAAPGAREEVLWSGYPYKPGDDLSESRKVLLQDDVAPLSKAPLPDGRFWPDGMIRGSGREFGGLLETPCYQHGEMTCLSCHTMHKKTQDPRSLEEWATDQLGLGMEGNQACLQCHSSFAADLEEHTHHPENSSGSSCYNCHMPYTSFGLLKAIRSHQVSSPSVTTSLETGRPNACSQCHLDQTLAWAADHLESWYETPKPELDAEQRSVAASLLWLLRGDAAQRALMAWSLGWESAQEASGENWQAPFLAQLLEDPYPAVRFIAARSLRSLPEFENLEFDFVAPEEERREVRQQVDRTWQAGERVTGPMTQALLLGDDGELQRELFAHLLAARDDRPIVVVE